MAGLCTRLWGKDGWSLQTGHIVADCKSKKGSVSRSPLSCLGLQRHPSMDLEKDGPYTNPKSRWQARNHTKLVLSHEDTTQAASKLYLTHSSICRQRLGESWEATSIGRLPPNRQWVIQEFHAADVESCGTAKVARPKFQALGMQCRIAI